MENQVIVTNKRKYAIDRYGFRFEPGKNVMTQERYDEARATPLVNLCFIKQELIVTEMPEPKKEAKDRVKRIETKKGFARRAVGKRKVKIKI